VKFLRFYGQKPRCHPSPELITVESAVLDEGDDTIVLVTFTDDVDVADFGSHAFKVASASTFMIEQGDPNQLVMEFSSSRTVGQAWSWNDLLIPAYIDGGQTGLVA